MTGRVVEAVALARVQAVAVDVDVRVAVGGVLEVDSTAGIVFAVDGVRFGLAGVVADGKGVGAVAVLGLVSGIPWDCAKKRIYNVGVIEGLDVGGDFARSRDAGQQNSDGSGSAHFEM